MKTRGILMLLAATALTAGNCDNTPSVPAPPPPGPSPTTYSAMISVINGAGRPVPGATITFIDGVFAGQTLTTDSSGLVTVTNAQGNMNVRASSTGCASSAGGFGPPVTPGGSQMLTLTLVTSGNNPWMRSGSGNNVFDMPRCVDRVRIRGTFNGGSSNWVVRIDGQLIVNELIGTFWGQTQITGTFLTSGGIVEITLSNGVTWTFTEIRT